MKVPTEFILKLPKKSENSRRHPVKLSPSIEMKYVEYVNLCGTHECDSIESEKQKLFEWIKAELENIEWAHLEPQVISDRLFSRALDHFGESEIQKIGYPKQGILS